jgi:multimeric flavodoxin WrbA
MVQKFRDFSLKENKDLVEDENILDNEEISDLENNDSDDDSDDDSEIENIEEFIEDENDEDVENEDVLLQDVDLDTNGGDSLNTKGSVVIINGCEADSEIDKKTSDFISKYGECKEIFLYQLNIQSPKKQEPKDGMLQVYSAIETADAVIFACQIIKNKLSDSMEIAIERIKNFYKKEELKNKVFGAIILGASDEKIKNELILTALNDFHMILSGDCLFFANDKSKSNMAKMVDTVKTLTDATAIINSGNYDETETEETSEIKPFDEFIDSEQTEDPDEQSFGGDDLGGEEDFESGDDETETDLEDEEEDSYSDESGDELSESLLSFDKFFKKRK